jgi:hypothetical protein
VVEQYYSPFATVGGVTLYHPSTRVEMIGFHESSHDGAQQQVPADSAREWVTLSTRGRGTGSRTAADIVTVELLAIQCVNGLLGFFGGAHGDETKSPGTAAHAVHHQVGFHDRAVRGERVRQIVFGGVEGKISDKQFSTHVMFTLS